MEADIDDILKNQGGFLVAEDFEAKFYNIIIEHYLCKFHHFYLDSTSNHFLHLNAAQPGNQAHYVDQTFDLKQKTKFTWLQRFMQKIQRRQRV